ncbi:hypothetical protein MKK64_08210 [Methylobacterium sp. E-025]|uniref:hypothetical protein n=1 Tax=unclassified Methylobacterium TaxID=2615210 RepID=UPI001FBAFF00|nr:MULTISPECIES: hypothetical protein [unclassified Methylobacterium]MCJ2079004.1 hypothetical protein [Methylobacterium sp. E-016]MCJ2111174.1 hypothetical protein [Methylobacterium sp. E-025]
MRGAALATILAAFALLASGPRPAAAAPLEAGASPCGGNAYSSAEVTEGRGRRRGPLTAVPDTLCADIETGQPPTRIELYGIPDRDGSAYGLGGAPGSAPYERSFRRRPSAD